MKTKENYLNKGFSLMEMAVIVIVVGVLFMSSASVLKGRNTSLKINTTEKHLQEAYNSLLGFAKTKYILPNNNVGGQDNFTSIFFKTDGQGNEFAYYPASSITNINGGNNICNVNNTNLKLEIANPGSTETLNNMAFVIASTGPDLESKITYQNVGGVPIVRIGRTDITKFDDTYRYVTLTELKGLLQCTQPNYKLKIMNNSLGQMNLNRNSKNIIYSNRNDTRWCMESSGIYGSVEYEKLHRNMDVKRLNPDFTSNSAITIRGAGQCSTLSNFQEAYALEIIKDQDTGNTPTAGTYKFKLFAMDPSYNGTPQQAYKTDTKIFAVTFVN